MIRFRSKSSLGDWADQPSPICQEWSSAIRGCGWFLLLAIVASSYQKSFGKTPVPNVVILLSDDLGWKDLGCYGGPVKTPAVDRLASDGMRFTNFYSGAAVCSPSRAVLLTGRTNLRSGIYSWINDHDQRTHLPEAEITLAELLKSKGYRTAHFGKWHLGMPSATHPDKPTPADHGFDYWFATANNAQPSHQNPVNFIRNGESVGNLAGYACDLVVDEAIAWLDSRSDRDEPFFLNVWFHEPHAPLAAPDNLVRQYGDQTDPAAVYSATIDNTDRAIKRLVDYLHRVNAPEDTLIVYASDNGSYRDDRVGNLRGSKGSNYEGGIRVPCIFYWPGKIGSGEVTDVPAGLVDLLPTICGLAGMNPPEVQLDGTDLSDLLVGRMEGIAREQPLFWALPLGGPAIAMRDGQYGMVAYRDGQVPRDLKAIAAVKEEIRTLLSKKGIMESETKGNGLAKQLFEGFQDLEAEKLRGRFIRLNQFHESWIPSLKHSKFTRFELYDLQKDPSQSQELSLRKPQVYHRLKTTLQRLADDVFSESFDWSSGEPAPGAAGAELKLIHRLKSTFRSPFDAFLYVNRIPTELESNESHEELSGRILGRLANQEGRVLVKLPPKMDRSAYLGFKVASDTWQGKGSGRCFSCHHLPGLGDPTAAPSVPSLRNRRVSEDPLRQVLQSDAHRGIDLSEMDLDRLDQFLKTTTDVSEKQFRDLILKATVLDTSGESE